jgi:site-specific DNA-methyltransferase (adenine-specific)
MNLFYQKLGTAMKTNIIYRGDCREVMPLIPYGVFDMILCDMPYEHTPCQWDKRLPLNELWPQFNRLCKPGAPIVLTACQPFASHLLLSNLKNYRHDWYWNKCMSGSFATAKYRPLPVVEQVLVFSSDGGAVNYYPIMETRGKPRQKGGYTNGLCYPIDRSKGPKYRNNEYYPKNLITFTNARQKGKIHATQKPVELFEYLIRTYTSEGDVVFDPCIGSGTTAIAALNTGRMYIGIEKDEDIFRAAEARIAAAREEKPIELDSDERAVYDLLSDKPVHIDEFCRTLQWPVARVSSALGLLEFKALAERESGMRFCLAYGKELS